MLQIKVGYSKIDDPKKGGFSFDNYIFHKLVEYGLTPTRACCGDQHLMIKKGIITKTEYNNPNQVLYNIEKWLRRSLIQLGVLNQSQVEALCCPTKQTVFIQSNTLYFGKKKEMLNMDLKKRLKKLLTDWSITFNDPCCSDYDEYYVFTYDLRDPLHVANVLYTDISTMSCSSNYTSPGNLTSSNSLIVNGTEYISTVQNYVVDNTSLNDVKNFYQGLSIPGATFRWVAADIGLYQELFKATGESNVTYLVMRLPKNTTVDSIFTFNGPTLYQHNTRILNPMDVFNTSTC